MLKKILSTVLAVAMIGAMSTNVFASEVESGEAATAVFTTESGISIPLEVKTTITRLNSCKNRTAEPDMYSTSVYVSGETKNLAGPSTSNNSKILASGILTMVWIDGKGTDTLNNEIVSLSGSWSANDGSSFKEGSLKWGPSGTIINGHNSVSQSFNQSIGFVDTTLSATSFGSFERYINGRNEVGTITIHVAPGIWN